MNPNIPREKVTWHPVINIDACIGDRVCVEFCKNDVFVWDEDHQRPVVQNPLNCVLGCDTCAQLCSVEAITFPSKDDLRRQLRELRAHIAQQAGGGGTPEPSP
jgi:NAD-dependent dihydropyrimidine dehydrogenase PreA subunit